MSENVSEQPGPILSYDGRIGDLYRIFLVNLLLTIVTLGLYRFWAVTRLRRYVWSRTSSFGQRFDYDGTGTQLFVGFLLAMAILIGMLLAAFAATAVFFRIVPHAPKALAALPMFLFELSVVVLALGAPFSAQRYRLNHTVWRGIRGGVTGSMIVYGIRALLYFILAALTFYQMAPWAMLRLYERKTNASFFGTQHFSAATRARAVYGRFLVALLGTVCLALLVFGAILLAERPEIAMLLHAQNPLARQQMANRLMLTAVPGYVLMAAGSALIWASFSAAYFRHITGHTQFGDLRFSSTVGTMTMLRLTFGNLLILACTLGLGLPIVMQRNMRFLAANLLGAGAPDLAALQQGSQKVSRFGEGMFQALDAGAGIG